MSQYKTSAIASLAAQFKRGPKRLRLKQLRNIEFLMSVVAEGKSYPSDFVCHALTGYRRRSGNGDNAASRLLEGDELRTDLLALAEDLSENADITVKKWPEPFATVGELAQRFDVSTKTIFRWHRRGLVGWRLRFSDRRVRLAFLDRCIQQFVTQNTDLVNRGSSFSQLSKAERNRIIERAAELAEGAECTVNSVAKIVAAEVGRAVETIRLILKNHDQARPKTGIFNRTKLQVGLDDQRLPVWEAYVDGTDVRSLAKRFGRPISWIYRTVTQMRARELKTRTIEYIHSEQFEATSADRDILAAPVLEAPSGEVTPAKRIPRDLPPYLQQLFRVPLLTREGEYAVFRKMSYLYFKADRARQALDPETVSASELDRIEVLLAEADEVKRFITQSNLRLVVSIAKRHISPRQEFFELVSDGNISLMRAVEKFDFTRGFKFSTYCSWAIIKNFARSVPEQKHHYDRYQTGRDEFLERLAGPDIEEHENDYLPAVRGVLERMLGVLDERDGSILRQRFGLSEHREPQTLEQIGRRFGVSKERIRQLEARALQRLRGEFDVDVLQLLGA